MADRPSRGVTIATLPAAARFVIRGGDAAATAIGLAFGVDLPREASRAARAGEKAALWLGPDEWLLLAPEDQAELMAPAMAQALAGEPASIVMVSDRNVGIGVSGPKAAAAINAFNPLDLHPGSFPVDTCTRTVFGKAEIVLWRTAAETFRIEVWRSFAPYVLECLEVAALEHRRDPAVTTEGRHP